MKIVVDKSVLEQVLEALEADNSKLWPSEKRTTAITALVAALAQQDKQDEPLADEEIGHME